MKTFRLSFVMLMVLGAMACNKTYNRPNYNNNTPETPTDEAADLISTSLAVNNNGAVNIVNDFTVNVQAKVRIDSLCGTTWTDTLSRQSPAGAQTTYSYNSTYSYTLTCSDNSKNNYFNGSATSSLVYSGSFNGPRLSSTNSGSSSFTVAGLGAINAFYTLNGEYKRSGTFQSKVDTSYSGSSNVDIVMTNLLLSKPYRVIKNGTASITVSDSTAKKGSFNYTGTLVFNGGNTATLTLNSTVYTIDLITGFKIRR